MATKNIACRKKMIAPRVSRLLANSKRAMARNVLLPSTFAA